jgi:hypothetical protein
LSVILLSSSIALIYAWNVTPGAFSSQAASSFETARSLSSGRAEPVIGRAFARPVGADPLAPPRDEATSLENDLDQSKAVVAVVKNPAMDRKPFGGASDEKTSSLN